MASGSVGFDFDLGGQHSGQHYLLLRQKDSPWWHWKLYWNPFLSEGPQLTVCNLTGIILALVQCTASPVNSVCNPGVYCTPSQIRGLLYYYIVRVICFQIVQ